MSPKEGGGRFLSGGSVQRFSAGDLVVLSSSGVANIQTANGKPLLFWWFSVSPEHLFPVFSARDIALLQTVVECLRTPKVYGAGEALTAKCCRLVEELPPQPDPVQRSQLVRVAVTVLTEELKAAQPKSLSKNGAEERFSRVFEELSTEVLLSLPVQQLARKFCCSRRHLNRLFHRYFGLSAVNLKMELRLLKSLALLRDENAKIIEVAHQSGFNHLGLFNTCFKRRFGKTPTEWRKLNEQRESHPNSAREDTGSALPQRPSGPSFRERWPQVESQPAPFSGTECGSLKSLVQEKADQGIVFPAGRTRTGGGILHL